MINIEQESDCKEHTQVKSLHIHT